MALARFDMAFELPGWIFEPKLDGFRTLAYVEAGACRLVSRNWNAFQTFEPLAQAIAQELAGRSAILDGEIVHPGPDGRPMFYELMRRRGPFCFYAFDLLWLDGLDLRERPPLGAEDAPAEAAAPQAEIACLRAALRERYGPIPCHLRAGHGGRCGEAGKRQVRAGSNDLGKDQEHPLFNNDNTSK